MRHILVFILTSCMLIGGSTQCLRDAFFTEEQVEGGGGPTEPNESDEETIVTLPLSMRLATSSNDEHNAIDPADRMTMNHFVGPGQDPFTEDGVLSDHAIDRLRAALSRIQ